MDCISPSSLLGYFLAGWSLLSAALLALGAVWFLSRYRAVVQAKPQGAAKANPAGAITAVVWLLFLLLVAALVAILVMVLR